MFDSLRLFRPLFVRRSRRGLMSSLLKVNAVYRERLRLASLPPERLTDLGLSEEDVAAELRRPAWDAPDRWLK